MVNGAEGAFAAIIATYVAEPEVDAMNLHETLLVPGPFGIVVQPNFSAGLHQLQKNCGMLIGSTTLYDF